jgi:polar amino acid transport system substrate-binding protein
MMDVDQVKTLAKQIIFSLCLVLPVQSQEFSVGWELWYPYQFHNKEKKLTGVDVEIFNLIADKANMSISYVELPWQRHLKYIKNGVVDIAFGASYTKERAETAYFCKRIGNFT